jgi:nitrogen fixation NifU-like protein
MDDLYREYILEHFREPHNKGDIVQPDRFATYSNPLCGDHIQMSVVLDGIQVSDVRFNGSGCAISQAAASMLTDLMIGKTLDELADITKQDIFEMLGVEISPARQRCALLSWEVMRKGILKFPEDNSDDDLD